MAITKIWLEELEPDPIGSFEIREELERSFSTDVVTVEYQVNEEIECQPVTQ